MSRWTGFGKPISVNSGGGGGGGLAAAVLTSLGIPTGTLASAGGNLSGVDIKRMDAMSVIKASLLEVMGSHFYDLTIDANGNACIVAGDSTPSPGDVYYTIQTYSYVAPSSHVVVTGAVPLPERRLYGPVELLSAAFNKKVWSADVIASPCAMPNMDRYATVTYDDPHYSSKYEDGIDNIYNVTDPYESVLGYTYDIAPTDPDVQITHGETAVVPIKVSGIGELVITPLEAAAYAGQDADCSRGLGVNANCSVPVNIPSELIYDTRNHGVTSKIIGVTGVFVVGYRGQMGFTPISSSKALETPSAENARLWFRPDDANLDLIRLSEGKNYSVCYEDGSISLAFADRAPLDMQGLAGEGVDVYIPADSATSEVYTQTIDLLPISEIEAVKVSEVWVAVAVATPCINVFSPYGGATAIAESLSIGVSAITIAQYPAPIAVNGGLYDQGYTVADNDPTTVQNFDAAPLESALASTGFTTGFSISMPSLDGGGCASLSGNIKAALDSDSGVGTTYVCGPGIGFVQVGGSVNSVEYRYNDKSSAGGSVSVGAKVSGNFVCSLSGGAYIKKTESVTAQAVVTGSDGSGCMYNVNIDGIGKRMAYSGILEGLVPGDLVTVTLNNNPVEA